MRSDLRPTTYPRTPDFSDFVTQFDSLLLSPDRHSNIFFTFRHELATISRVLTCVNCVAEKARITYVGSQNQNRRPNGRLIMSNVDAKNVDRRHALPVGNMFRSYRRNSLPTLKPGAAGNISTKTAEEYESERLTKLKVQDTSVACQ